MINISYNGKCLVKNGVFSKGNGCFLFSKVVDGFIIGLGVEIIKDKMVVMCNIKTKEKKLLYVERSMSLRDANVFPFKGQVVEETVRCDDSVETIYRDLSRVIFNGDSNLEFEIRL